MDLLFVIFLFLAGLVAACVVYFRSATGYEAKIVRLRKEVSALQVENRKLRHEVGLLTERCNGLMESKAMAAEKAATEMPSAGETAPLDSTEVLAELLRCGAITAADLEKVNKYKKDAKSETPAEELLVVLDFIPHAALVAARNNAARRAKSSRS